MWHWEMGTVRKLGPMCCLLLLKVYLDIWSHSTFVRWAARSVGAIGEPLCWQSSHPVCTLGWVFLGQGKLSMPGQKANVKDQWVGGMATSEPSPAAAEGVERAVVMWDAWSKEATPRPAAGQSEVCNTAEWGTRRCGSQTWAVGSVGQLPGDMAVCAWGTFEGQTLPLQACGSDCRGSVLITTPTIILGLAFSFSLIASLT